MLEGSRNRERIVESARRRVPGISEYRTVVLAGLDADAYESTIQPACEGIPPHWSGSPTRAGCGASPVVMKLQVEVGDRIRTVEVVRQPDGFHVLVDGHPRVVDAVQVTPDAWSLLVRDSGAAQSVEAVVSSRP